MKGPCRAVAILVASLAGFAVAADPIEVVGYDRAATETALVVDFEILPPLPEPGHNLDHGFAFSGGRAGERFAGQSLSVLDRGGGAFDALSDAGPTAPLALLSGAPDEGLSVSFHRSFRSNALYPLGPARWPAPEARGEGALAVLFDADACAVALRIHTEYEDDLGSAAGHEGLVRLRFYTRDAILIEDRSVWLGPGITSLGFLRDAGQADIAGLVITNLDPGGVSFDDLRFGCPKLVG